MISVIENNTLVLAVCLTCSFDTLIVIVITNFATNLSDHNLIDCMLLMNIEISKCFPFNAVFGADHRSRCIRDRA